MDILALCLHTREVVPAKALIKLDLQIAILREKMAKGDSSPEVTHTDLAKLLQQREQLVKEFVATEAVRKTNSTQPE